MKLLIVEDDDLLRARLGRSMARFGFDIRTAANMTDARQAIKDYNPSHALLDMKLGEGNGLELVDDITHFNKDIRIVMLTGFGNVASAVSAIKKGAIDFLAKPADPEQIFHALINLKQELPPPPDDPMSADRVRWEHIQRVYEQCDRNVSEAARRLKLYRRTLQRILQKHAPHE